MRKRGVFYQIFMAVSILALLGRASWATPIDFDSLMDSQVVSTQFASDHMTFANAITLTAGLSLNEFEFAPHSGNSVVSDAGGAMLISFSAPFGSVGGYFNYKTQLTLTAFSDAAGTIAIGGASVKSSFNSNLGLSGDSGSSLNEFLQLTGIGPIGSIRITGDPGGGSFTLDDFNGTLMRAGFNDGIPTPEPASLLLLGSGVVGTLWLRRRRG